MVRRPSAFCWVIPFLTALLCAIACHHRGITVKGNTGTIGSLKDVVASFNKVLQTSNPNAPGVVDQQEFSLQGRSVYYVTYKDASGLLFGNYIISDKSGVSDILLDKSAGIFTVVR